MTTNYAITIVDGEVVEAVYVRTMPSHNEFDFEDCEAIVEYISVFLDVPEEFLSLKRHSLFSRYAFIVFDNRHYTKDIVVTWETFQ